MVRPPVILIDDVEANVSFAGLIATGVYQFNVVVPAGVRTGNVPVVASEGGFTTPPLLMTAIKTP